ncbi:DUF222 domain-containing protein [Georgenia yuyongxinii]
METDEAPGVREEWESRYGLVSAPAIFLERLAPGGRLASVLGALCVADADDATVVEAIAGAERLASWAMAVQARAVRELTDRRGPSSQALSSVGAEISARLGITGYAGQAKVHFAAALDLFPEVADALTTGRIDTRKADVLLNREDGLPLTEHSSSPTSSASPSAPTSTPTTPTPTPTPAPTRSLRTWTRPPTPRTRTPTPAPTPPARTGTARTGTARTRRRR